MGIVKIKPGVSFVPMAPAGMRILEVLKSLTHAYPFDVTITSGTDGKHSSPADPHYSGEAYDIRTKDLTDPEKQQLLRDLINILGSKFHAFIEAPGTDNEHIHCQRDSPSTHFTIEDYFNEY